ncbi:DNA gyrase subunit A [compost metagenome]
MNATDKVGKLVAIREVTEEDDLMIITRNGIAIRMSVLDIRQAGRNTQGVKLIRLNSSDEITSVTRILKDPDEKAEDELDEDGNVVVKPVAQVEGASAEDIIVSDDELDEDEDVADDEEEDDEEPSDDAEA